MKSSPRSLLSSFHCAHFTFTGTHLPDLYGECFRLDGMPSLSGVQVEPVRVPAASWLWVHHKSLRRLIVYSGSEKIREILGAPPRSCSDPTPPRRTHWGVEFPRKSMLRPATIMSPAYRAGSRAEFRLTMSITVFLLKPTLRAMRR